mmetsp:Transcript_9896/g.18003  ORF Transcript_9896/g.18003 Transcript_9896/m.18003 type:complete len:97 (-) Transcript_9896:1235-1525(-)
MKMSQFSITKHNGLLPARPEREREREREKMFCAYTQWKTGTGVSFHQSSGLKKRYPRSNDAMRSISSSDNTNDDDDSAPVASSRSSVDAMLANLFP